MDTGVAKKKWESPVLFDLDINETASGGSGVGGPEAAHSPHSISLLAS